MSNVEGWIRFAQSFKINRIPYSMFDAYSPPQEDSTFISFFSDQTGCPLAGGSALMKRCLLQKSRAGQNLIRLWRKT
jgi:hypothetical protein